MIIKYPTGLYTTVLPKRPDDSGNVTFLISNTAPPRSSLLFPKVPLGIVEKRRKPQDINIVNRRKNCGGLVFSISKAVRKEEGNNSRQFEIGQVLDFNEGLGRTVDVMLVNDTTEIRHDTNVFNYEQIGITVEEQMVIAEASLMTQDQLSNQLNELKQLRSDAEQVINVQQKLINDTTKLINSLNITLSEGSVIDIKSIITKLEKTRAEAFTTRDKAISDANSYAAEAEVVLDKLRSVGVLVK